uniref:Uncharacterized protein n=1 Tax=viral metagenome TaxID=1070528 RepID=A0A6C0CMP8_9ZZZZ
MMWGVEAASVISDRYEYSYNIPNTTISISIDALPRDVYKDTKALASILLTMSACSFLVSGVAIASICVKNFRSRMPNAWWPNELLVAMSTFAVSMLPFAYGAFILWKYETMSEQDKTTWNNVDSRFMHVFSQSKPLLIMTALPFAFWSIVCTVLAIQYLRQSN